MANPGRPISPETMAVHHILDREVVGAPLWKEIAAITARPTNSCVSRAPSRI